MIKYYNGKTNDYEVENVAGQRYLNWTYESPIGRSFLNLVVKKKIFSKLYGKYCDSDSSKKNIHKFIKNFDIDMSLCKKNIFEFESFNDFFARELTSVARPINMLNSSFISPADGRVFAYEDINLDKIIQVKGYTYSLKELLKDYSTASVYNGGTCVVIRLCPTDYHRFHFVDNGTCGITSKIKGEYYSVNPVALKKIPQLYCRNKREWSVFSSENFGDILYVEVGATCVGTIIQSYNPSSKIKKGEEKGYFKFGGSTVILFLEPNKVKINSEILKQTSLGFETKVNMGEKIGEVI